MHRYTVLSPIKVNGRIAAEGEVVEVDDATAPRLVRRGVLTPVNGEPILAQVCTTKSPPKRARKAK